MGKAIKFLALCAIFSSFNLAASPELKKHSDPKLYLETMVRALILDPKKTYTRIKADVRIQSTIRYAYLCLVLNNRFVTKIKMGSTLTYLRA